MAPRSSFVLSVKLLMGATLAAWACIWILKPTKLWKRSWHYAEDWANTTFLGASGLNVVVFCFPLLAVATMGYIHLYLSSKIGNMRQRANLVTRLTDPIVVRSPIGILSSSELLIAAMFIVFITWTYYSNVSSDFKKLTPSKTLKLNRWQLKVMAAGVRFGSVSEACLAVLLLPVLRGMALFRIFDVQYEASVRYHIWIGNMLIVSSLCHGILIMFVWAEKKSLLEQITKWQRTGRVYVAGAITLTTGIIIWITSLPPIRREQFQLFYSIHHLYVVFLLFFLLHAGDRHFFLVFSGILLFAIDKILRIIQSARTTSLISASILPCKAVELTLSKHASMKYTPTSMIFVKIPSISKFQWHPFSIISSSNKGDDRFSVLVKCQGQWTSSLYKLIESMLDDDGHHAKSLSLAFEGPYGPAAFPYQRYDSLIFVAGGSGITPFLSILQDIASRKGPMGTYPMKVQLIYAVKKSEDISMLAPICPLLLNHSAEIGKLKLRIFVTQEERSVSTAREILHEMYPVKTVVFDECSSRDGVPRPEGLLWRAAMTGICSISFLASLVVLDHIFIPRGKQDSQSKVPSWVSDLLVICSFAVAASFGIIATAIVRWRKQVNGPHAILQKRARPTEMHPFVAESNFEELVINFGRRPNLIDVLSELEREAGESEVGVFVCGPESMRDSVASFCRRYATKGQNMERKLQKCSLTFHWINFSF